MLQALKRLEPQLPHAAPEAEPSPVVTAPAAEAVPADTERADLFSAAICHVAEAIQVLPPPIDLPAYPEIAFSASDLTEPLPAETTRPGLAGVASASDAARSMATPYEGLAADLAAQLGASRATAVALVSLGRVDRLLAMVVPLADAMRTHFPSLLVVDCDLREPTLSDRFAVPADHGLIDLLPGPARWQEVVRPTQLPGVDLLPGRRLVAADGRPPERLDLQPLVHEWLDRYQLILLAAGPIRSPETVSLLRSAHAAVLVVEQGRTHQRSAQRAMRTVRSAGAHVLGTILACGASQTTY
jgi:Mrp family chromosome partitioning ATPase